MGVGGLLKAIALQLLLPNIIQGEWILRRSLSHGKFQILVTLQLLLFNEQLHIDSSTDSTSLDYQGPIFVHEPPFKGW